MFVEESYTEKIYIYVCWVWEGTIENYQFEFMLNKKFSPKSNREVPVVISRPIQVMV